QERSTIILTASGGVQEAAPSVGKPVLVMRQNTARPEAVVSRTVKLVRTNRSLIVAEAKLLLDDEAAFTAIANAVNPYGDGKAAERSGAAIASLLGLGNRAENFSPGTDIEEERIPSIREVLTHDVYSRGLPV